MQGESDSLTGEEFILNGSIKVGSGEIINAKGMSINDVISAINSQGEVTASITDGKFTISSKNGAVSINANGDLARITGLDNYVITSSSSSNTPGEYFATIEGSTTNLYGGITVIYGSVKIGNGTEINTSNKTLDEIISEINAQGEVTASITNGKFTIISKSGTPSITATGDFARISGLSDYTTSPYRSTRREESFINQITRIKADNIPADYTAIYTAEDLQNITNNTSGKYILMKNIDLSTITNWQSIQNFDGILDGNGHTISAGQAVLFTNTVATSEIKNLALENFNINSNKNYTAALVGKNAGKITNCFVKNSDIEGKNYTGGLVGLNQGKGEISDSFVDSACYIQGNEYVGGFVGENRANITKCYTEADTTGYDLVGGFAAQNSGKITNSYANGGTVYATISGGGSDSSGFVHTNTQKGIISNVYTTYGIPITNGCLVTMNYGSITNSAYRLIHKNNYSTKGVYNKENSDGTSGTSSNIIALENLYKQTNTPPDSSNFTNIGWGTDIWDFSDKIPSFNNKVLYYSNGAPNFDENALDKTFYGQQDGIMTFSDGTTIEIKSTDTCLDIMEKINTQTNCNIGYYKGPGFASISIDGPDYIVSDTSGFSDIYELLENSKTYNANPTTNLTYTAPKTSTLTSSVDTRDFADAAFYGQNDGILTFSDGTFVSISATDSLSDVINKIVNAGLIASINALGKIEITAQNTENLSVSSDSSGFSDFYGLSSGKTYNGSISTFEITTPDTPDPTDPDNPDPTDPDNPDPTDPDNPDPTDPDNPDPTDPDNPDPDNPDPVDPDNPDPIDPDNPDPVDPDKPSITGNGNIRLQIGAYYSDTSVIYVDTNFIFDNFNIDFSSAESCKDSIDTIDSMLTEINKKQAHFGAMLNRLDSVLQSQTINIENFTGAKSTILDADIAEESSNLIRNQILQQTSVSLLTQAQNLHSSLVLSLIR